MDLLLHNPIRVLEPIESMYSSAQGLKCLLKVWNVTRYRYWWGHHSVCQFCYAL